MKEIARILVIIAIIYAILVNFMNLIVRFLVWFEYNILRIGPFGPFAKLVTDRPFLSIAGLILLLLLLSYEDKK